MALGQCRNCGVFGPLGEKCPNEWCSFPPPAEQRIEVVPHDFIIEGNRLLRRGNADVIDPWPRIAVVAEGKSIGVVLEPGLEDVPEVIAMLAECGKRYLCRPLTRDLINIFIADVEQRLRELEKAFVIGRALRRQDVHGRLEPVRWERRSS